MNELLKLKEGLAYQSMVFEELERIAKNVNTFANLAKTYQDKGNFQVSDELWKHVIEILDKLKLIK